MKKKNLSAEREEAERISFHQTGAIRNVNQKKKKVFTWKLKKIP